MGAKGQQHHFRKLQFEDCLLYPVKSHNGTLPRRRYALEKESITSQESPASRVSKTGSLAEFSSTVDQPVTAIKSASQGATARETVLP